jgi:hypothetical protein
LAATLALSPTWLLLGFLPEQIPVVGLANVTGVAGKTGGEAVFNFHLPEETMNWTASLESESG